MKVYYCGDCGDDWEAAKYAKSAVSGDVLKFLSDQGFTV
jgi:hypothetical protein